MNILKARTLPAGLTSYDLLKSFALMTMIIDHIGFFIFPDEELFRLFGRLSMPVWFFLIGYAKNRSIDALLIGGALAVTVLKFIFGMQVLPLNILISIILVRLTLAPFSRIVLQNELILFAAPVFLAAIYFQTHYLIEYGSLCFSIALCGALLRVYHDRPEGEKTTGDLLRVCATFFLAGYCYIHIQQALFGFSGLSEGLFIALISLLFTGLLFFKPREFSALSEKIPETLSLPLKLCGRRSLEIYVIHIGILGYINALFAIHDRGFFEWVWF